MAAAPSSKFRFSFASSPAATHRSTRISSLIPKGNDPPQLSEEDEARLLKERAEKRKLLTAKQADIERLLRELDVTKAEASAVSNELDEYRRLFDPIRRVPIEILQKIFLACMAQEMRHSLDVKSSSWTVAQVCRKWRGAALGCPSLWSRLDVKFTDRWSADKWQSTCCLLGTYLTRSGFKPLNVSLIIAITLSNPHPIIPLLVLSAPRWRSLTIETLPQNFAVLLPIREFLSSLETLDIRFDSSINTWPSNVGDAGLKLFERASRLHTLHASSPLAAKFSLPWDGISCLHAHALPPTSDVEPFHLTLMKQAKKAATVNLAVPSFPFRPETSIVKYLHITQLTVESNTGNFDSSFEVTDALNSLSMPNLVILRVCSQKGCEKLSSLKLFLERSKAKLHTLELSLPCSFNLTAKSILGVAENLVDLEELSIEASMNAEMEKLLKELGTAPTKYLPRLKTLKLSGAVFFSIRQATVDELKNSRKELNVYSSRGQRPVGAAFF